MKQTLTVVQHLLDLADNVLGAGLVAHYCIINKTDAYEVIALGVVSVEQGSSTYLLQDLPSHRGFHLKKKMIYSKIRNEKLP